VWLQFFQTDADASVDLLEAALPPRSASADARLLSAWLSVASGLDLEFLQQQTASPANHHSSNPINIIPTQMLSTSRLSEARDISSAKVIK
jgi:hypothetical protein